MRLLTCTFLAIKTVNSDHAIIMYTHVHVHVRISISTFLSHYTFFLRKIIKHVCNVWIKHMCLITCIWWYFRCIHMYIIIRIWKVYEQSYMCLSPGLNTFIQVKTGIFSGATCYMLCVTAKCATQWCLSAIIPALELYLQLCSVRKK